MLNQMFGNRNLSKHQALISSCHLNLKIDQSRGNHRFYQNPV